MVISHLRVESNFHTPCIFMRVSKIGYSLIMLRSKFHYFLRIFSTSLCTLFCTRTIINISVYCNFKNLINYHTFLVQNTASGFLQKNVLESFETSSTLISKLHRWFSPFFSRLFPIFWMNRINYKIPNKTYVWYIFCWKESSKLTNHSDSHDSPA